MKKYFLIMLMVLLANTGIIALFSFVDDDTHDFNTNKYCYAYWAPHGSFWQDVCYSDKKTCTESLRESNDIGRRHNTKKCYKEKFVDAYCVDNVTTGDVRIDLASGKPAYRLITVCTLDLSECKKYEQYSVSHSRCKQEMNVSARESETAYLQSKHDLEDIISKNKKLSSDVRFSDSKDLSKHGCMDYDAAPNQQSAFENLGLNWKKTKNWGAFVDVDGNLRANKPSCRLIKRDSEEYNRYK